MKYTLIRSRRKTVALYVRAGLIEVRAPLKMPKSTIDRFVASKEDWVTERLNILETQQRRRDDFTVDYGDEILYRGKRYPVTKQDVKRAGFDGERFCIPPNLSAEQVKHACVQVYRALAAQHIKVRAYEFAETMSVSPSAVKINKARSRWGSCSAKKSINFSWYLIMADDDLIDCIIVHELAHLIEMNHSARFWAIVESVLPDYKNSKARLKVLQNRLSGENWE